MRYDKWRNEYRTNELFSGVTKMHLANVLMFNIYLIIKHELNIPGTPRPYTSLNCVCINSQEYFANGLSVIMEIIHERFEFKRVCQRVANDRLHRELHIEARKTAKPAASTRPGTPRPCLDVQEEGAGIPEARGL